MLRTLPLILLLLTSIALADPFLDKLDYCYPRYDWRGAVEAVLENPERAEAAVPELRKLAGSSERQRAFDLRFYADFIERVLHVHAGRPKPENPKTSWKGSPIESDPSAIDVTAQAELARKRWKQAAVAVDAGAYRVAERWLRDGIKASHRIAWALQPVPADLVNLQKRYRLYIMGLSQTGYIYPQSADFIVVQELERGNWEEAQLGLMAMVQAGRLAYDPEMVDRYLPRLVEKAEGHLRFAALTFEFEREAQRNELGWPRFKERHRQIWKQARFTEETSRDPLLAPLRRRWAAEAVQFWLDELNYYANREPEAALLLKEDLERMQAAGWNELVLAHQLDRAELARLDGNLELAGGLHQEVERALVTADSARERAYRALGPQELRASSNLGFLEARLAYQRFRMVVDGKERLDPRELKEAALHLKKVIDATDEFEERIGRLAAEVEYGLLVGLEGDPAPFRHPLELLFKLVIAEHAFDDPVELARVLVAQARIHLQTKTESLGLAGLEKAVNRVETYLEKAQASPRRARQLRDQARRAYEMLAQLKLEKGQNEEALELLSRLAQVETAQVMKEALTRGAPAELESTLKEVELLRDATERLEESSRKTTQSGAVTREKDLQVVGELLADTRARYYQTVKNLQQAEPDFTRLTVRPLNFARLQPSIPEDTTVVQYFPAPDKLYVFVADRRNLKVRSLNVGREELEGKILRSLSALSKSGLQSEGDWSHPQLQKVQSQLTELHQLLIAPIESDLADRPVLAVIPSGLLSYLPFPALISGTGEGRPRFLVEDRRAVTILKAVDLDSLSGPPSPREGTLLGYGNPDGTLAAAEAEVKSIGKLFPRNTILTTTGATTASLRQKAAENPAFVHLATHGVVNPNEPLESFLVMADGPLTLADITGLNLGQPSLVTLSACRTGLGETRVNPGQDLTTLAEAFWYAGSRCLVASLWRVADTSTGELMLEFYRGLTTDMSKAEALQKAQLALLSKRETSAPYFWAPFVLIGDWR